MESRAGTGHTANVVLANLHAPVWWGGLLLVLGLFYGFVSPQPQRFMIFAYTRSKQEMTAQRTMTFGIVVGNRGFFPGHLAKTGREEIISVLEAAGAKAIVLGPEESKHGAVETYAESQRCAELFKKHADEIDGIIVTLPNFGEERGIVDAIRLSGLKVPVLVQATPDRSDNMTIAVRRDSFCGKMSACNNMMQYGIPYSLTTLHTESLSSPEFKADLEWFSAGLPHRQGPQESAHRRHRRASRGLQHRPLLRAHPRDRRHLHRADRSVGDLRPHQPHEG
jgi:hypothetical protein